MEEILDPGSRSIFKIFHILGYVRCHVNWCNPSNPILEETKKWVFPKIVVFPNHPFGNRGFPYFHHPFWGVFPLFLVQHPNNPQNIPKDPSILIHPKNPFVCPIGKGLGPLHSYSFRMRLEPENSYSIGRGVDS